MKRHRLDIATGAIVESSAERCDQMPVSNVNSPDPAPQLVNSGRVIEVDKRFDHDVRQGQFMNVLFTRLVAKSVRFENVDFKYSIFDTCYLRSCTFDSCDFTGCRFVATNLHGSSFSGCIFEYTSFERTIVDDDILLTGCPGYENLKVRFARALRMNYQQLGDAKSVNRAISIELQATEIHLHKAWSSPESYYRKKYRGLQRFQMFAEWLRFKVLDLIWGNGESLPKVIRAVFIILVVMALADALCFRDQRSINSFVAAFLDSPQVLLGSLTPKAYPSTLLAIIVFVRLFVIGLLMSITIKRLSRR